MDQGSGTARQRPLHAMPPADRPRAKAATRRRGRGRRGHRGQSVVEFALVLPVTMLVILAGLDFGRVFLGWVELHQVARHGADFAAENPDAWNSVNPNTAAQAEYARQLRAEAAGIDCTMPSPLPTPAFSTGPSGIIGIGTPVSLAITCRFGLITPVIGAVLGSGVNVSAAVAFPVRNGTIFDIATPTPSPSPTPTRTPDHDGDHPTPTPSPTPTPTPTPVITTPPVNATASPTPTPAQCIVPNLVGKSIKDIADIWGTGRYKIGSTWYDGAGFTTSLIFWPGVGPSDKGNVTSQTLVPNTSSACSYSTMTVYWSPS